MDEFKRNCPGCDKEIVYSKKYSFVRAIKENRYCFSCTMKSSPKTGPKLPEIKKSLLDGLIWCDNDVWYRKCPKCNKNTKSSSYDNAYRRLNSVCHSCGISKNVGSKRNEKTKNKQRSIKLKKFQELGISACVDKGSKEYFDRLNKKGFSFKPKVFIDIGYVADGYDENKHIWIEYDTPYHNSKYQRNKDKMRQENIIKHFEEINNPLKSFIRVKSDEKGNILEEKCIYEPDKKN